MIHIDPRLGSGPLHALFLSHRQRPPCSLTTLPAADFAFTFSGPENLPALMGIERKTITDMMSSIRLQRLSGEQIPKLLDHYQSHVFIVLEGIYRINTQTGYLEWPRRDSNGKRVWVPIKLGKYPMYGAEVVNALNTIQLKTPIKIWRTGTPEETVDWVVGLWDWGQKDWDSHSAHVGIHTPSEYVTVGKASTVRRVSYALNKVGWELSGILEQNFRNVPEMIGVKELIPFEEHVKTWERCKPTIPESAVSGKRKSGFGKVLAAKVLRELRGMNGDD